MDKEGKKELMMMHMCIFKTFNALLHEKDKDFDIYPGQPRFLVLLKKFPGINQKELANRSKTKASSITGMIQRMEKLGYIKRVPDAEDKRIMRVYLTRQGDYLATKCENFIEELVEQVYKGFTKEEMEQHKTLLQKMHCNIKVSNVKSE